MKKNFYRWGTGVLALLLCLSAFSACQNQPADEPDGPEIPSASDSTSEVTTSVPRPVLPPEKLPDMNPEIESNAGDTLSGYTKDQLVEKWGYPFGELYGENGYGWLMENGMDYVLAYFDSEDYVTEMRFFHVMKATVQEVSDDQVTLIPRSEMEEAAVLESFILPLSAFGEKTQEKLAEGLMVFISYDGIINENGSLGKVYRAESSSPMSQFARY